MGDVLGIRVNVALKRLCFQEIHNLQSKKTDVGELEKEREEAMQRLQVRWQSIFILSLVKHVRECSD